MSGFQKPQSQEEMGKQFQAELNKEKANNSTTINKKLYKVKPLGAEQGLVVWENLLALLGPSIGVGFDSLQHNEIVDGSPTTFSEAILLLQRKLDGSQLVNYSHELFGGLQCNGEEVTNWSDHFSANYGEWTQVVIFALKENFQSFFVESGFNLNLQEMMKRMKKVLPQPQSSDE